MKPYPALPEGVEDLIFNHSVDSFSAYVANCFNEELNEFFYSNKLSETSFFSEVTQELQSLIGVFWEATCDFIDQKTDEIKKAVFLCSTDNDIVIH